MKRNILALLLLFFWGITPLAHAKTLKIAVIDMQAVVRQSQAGQQALVKLQQKFDTLKQKLQKKESEIKKLKQELEKKAPLLSPEARQEKERQYQKMLREYQAQREDAQFEMRQAEQEALKPILKDLRHVVKDMAKKEGYDLILEKNMPGVYWASPQLDLTKHVIELYNQYLQRQKEKK